MDVHIQSVLLTGKEHRNQKIKQLNRMLNDYAVGNGHSFIDLNLVLSEEGFLSPRYTNDGLHLNGLGYKVWGEHISAYLP